MVVNILMGTALGFLSGLGIGGGSLLILWLTLGMGMEAAMARTINLMFFLPSAIIALLFRWQQGTLPVKKVLPAMISGAVTAGVVSFYSRRIDLEILKKGFGILLLATGLREIFYRRK